jgi:hypothetical protein
MTVYVRTEEGQLAAYSRDSALPRKLRALLKVIDGKTSLDVYTSSLKAFGDVQGVLKSLDMAGLIRPMSQLPPGTPKPEAQEPSTALKSSMFRSTMQNSPDTQASYMHTRNADSMMARSDPNAEFVRAQALARAVDAMSNFILAYTPEHSFMVLKELEQMTQLEQVAVTLGGYEQLVKHVGAPAQEHLAFVKNLLREYM